ncbi:exonuclease SbcCD subunit D [Paenalkalicoccus suaedae]|uniref:Nuclease SbcCD subunit D n=1 Tax=Paenalkalicoccus suaedae TaxID=2592382 RepID=A0A859FES0_9BACI|nr:exonuclease SbcCD subunit D [Paenalkalicoccus suaedae]QKS71192.1 exonuclease SbcCD subunit D [Paenalkalicoccus suaedae]
MRLLHTADWHIGKTIEGRDRLAEHAAFFMELKEICKDEKIDAILMAGDVFDTVNPPAKGEELFYESMARLSDNGELPIILIAGNHDHPERLSAAKQIMSSQHIYVRGLPSLEPIYVPVKDSLLQVAALPYPSESRLKTHLSESIDELALRDAYDEKIADIFSHLTKDFTSRHVQVTMSHLFVAGGASTESERPIEVGGAYTVRRSQLPTNVQYNALGHLHRPQTLKTEVPSRYAGSPLAFSFQEAGFTKSVTVIDVEPGQTATIKEIPLSSGRPLVKWKLDGIQDVFTKIEAKDDASAWIELSVNLTDAMSMEQLQKIRTEYPQIVTIRPVYQATEEEEIQREKLSIDQLFEQFYARQTGGATPDPDLTQLFMEIIEEEDHS